jgi:hypothetical protein
MKTMTATVTYEARGQFTLAFNPPKHVKRGDREFDLTASTFSALASLLSEMDFVPIAGKAYKVTVEEEL